MNSVNRAVLYGYLYGRNEIQILPPLLQQGVKIGFPHANYEAAISVATRDQTPFAYRIAKTALDRALAGGLLSALLQRASLNYTAYYRNGHKSALRDAANDLLLYAYFHELDLKEIKEIQSSNLTYTSIMLQQQSNVLRASIRSNLKLKPSEFYDACLASDTSQLLSRCLESALLAQLICFNQDQFLALIEKNRNLVCKNAATGIAKALAAYDLEYFDQLKKRLKHALQ